MFIEPQYMLFNYDQLLSISKYYSDSEYSFIYLFRDNAIIIIQLY